MAEIETPDTSTNIIRVTEEIDGDQIPTRNYRFSKIGEPIPITSDADFKFDMDSLPSRPLAVSERLGLVFIAHLSGFSVARMKDVMDAAEELKNEVEGPCIQELSVVDVSLGKVSILALSADSSTLAASVGLNLYFFSANGLLNKDPEPSYFKSLSGSSCIKEMQWSSLLEDQYVVLTHDGSLYRGAGQGDLNHVMDNVDAVDWSMNGKFIAVAKDGLLSILSSKFHEKLRIKLLFDSLVDGNPNCVVKVDSVKWVRPDCIALGCYCLSDDGKEENHLIQFISVKDGKITNSSSSPVASTFRDAFLAINEDDIPSGNGPYTLISYLDDFEVAFVANKKNTNQHISLFNWSEDGAVMVEIESDSWLPTINLQVHDDADNMILGLAINKEYKDEKTILECGEVEQKVSPCCILMCVTVDGRFCMFHFASAVGPSALSEDFSSVSDEEEEPQVIDSQHPVINIVKDARKIDDQGHQKVKNNDQEAKIDDQKAKTDDQKAKIDDPKVKVDDQKVKVEDQNVKIDDHRVKVNEPTGIQQGVPLAKPNYGRDEGQSLLIPKKEDNFEPSVNSVPKSANDKLNKSPFQISTELPVNKPLFGSSGTFSSGPLFSSNAFGVPSSSSSGSLSTGGLFSSSSLNLKSSQSSHTAVQVKPDTSLGTIPKLSFSKMTSGSSTSSNLLSQGALAGAAFSKSLPVSNAQPSLSKSPDFKFPDKGNFKNQTSSRLSNTESNLSEQHGVKEMAKELDALLDSIEKPGGFYHASVTAHKQSVAELQEGISVLSDRCRKWTDKMHQGCEEVQLLLDKTVQVLARKIYIEAIMKQSTDSQYLDIWNHQKLSSELDMKRRHILEINQNLTKQLIELERHLNTLELQRFGDKSDPQMSRRSSHTKHNPPRHIQSLHSLQNTMNAQLTAAEKLSECLSKQMAVLNIEPEPKKKQSVKKELFDTIGISYDDTAFSSPGQEKSQPTPPKSQLLISSYSKKSQQGAVKSSEPETARRRIDSLDKSWASIEPPKTTVKRMLLQDDRQMSPARLSLSTATPKLNNRLHQRSVVSHDIPHGALNMLQIRGGQDVQMKRNSEEQSNTSLGYRSDLLSSGSQSTPNVTRDAAKETHNLTAENSNRLTFTLKSDASIVKDPKFSQQSKSSPEPSLTTAKSPAFSMFQKKPSEYSESTQKPFMGETSSLWSRKGTESSAVLSSSSSTAFSGKSFSLEASTRESQSSIAASPVPVTSAPTSLTFKNTTSSSVSALPFGKSSTGFGYTLGSTQTTPSSGLSYSFPSFSSSTSSTKQTSDMSLNTSKSEPSKLNPDTGESSKPEVVSVPNFDLKPSQALPQPVISTPSGATSQPSPSFLSFPSTTSSTKPTLNVDLNTSKSEPFKLNLDTSETSKPQAVSFAKFDPKPSESPFGQILPPQPVLSASSGPTSQPSTSTISESQVNLNSKPDQPSVSPAVSSPVTINPVDVASGQTNESDLTQEDEMEEEAPDTTQFTLGNLGGFGLGSSPSSNQNPSAPKQNPFGAPFGNTPASAPITSFSSPPGGGLFKPASFSVDSQQPSQPPQQTGFGGVGIFGGNSNQSSGGQGFGQPARVGSGQQALGSVLGSFGQSRQFGAVLPGSVASSNPFGGGFGGSQTAGGFATASSGGGGFASLASGGGGGFAAAATGGGGFAAAATGAGGFGAAATGAGGFGGAPTTGGGFGAPAPLGGGFGGAPVAGGGFGGAPGAGGGFAGVTPGGFGAFSGQGGSGFSTFGGGGAGKPPSELFTQMRK